HDTARSRAGSCRARALVRRHRDVPARGVMGRLPGAAGQAVRVDIGGSDPDDDGVGPDARNLARLITLSDGIFAIAMTLLVLDIHVTGGLDAAGFRHMVYDLLPHIGAYALSFAILAGFWRDHRRILRLAHRVEGLSLRLALAGLGAIALLPFPTTLLSEYASEPLAVALYSATVIVIDLLQLALLLTLRRDRRPARGGGPYGDRGIVTDLTVTVVVFGATVPIAFASPRAALWTWLVLIPLRFTFGRRARRPGSAR
ncbi:TMEM175 family protein, partial [Streptomyces sp. NPDC058459]|uniref:TMEM175 family protein n=1 Tax=Streptomyces sp. NPDC058459 TaxID=3346508 RepID=UPI0036487672